jgi:hypothetical protein
VSDERIKKLPRQVIADAFSRRSRGRGQGQALESIARPIEVAEVLAVLEAITGMFYLAIIVASLVGAMRSDRPGEK